MTRRVLLASGSPRRRRLLETLGFEVVVRPAQVDERGRAGEDAERLVVRLAEAKARAVTAEAGLAVLAADTVVEVDERIIGKPRDRDEARAILAQLAGREHRVWTGICVIRGAGAHSEAVVSTVHMRALTAGEIASYVATGEADDKAGAYGIQERGAALVESVTGSYTNVVGLPLTETLRALG